jgi:GC-rich sequence DNA-binding factor-like protein
MKLLNKFGFTGRLGAREDGVSRAIEVVVRPNGQGLGFGDFTESSALVVNKKLVAEWSGVEYKEEEIAATAKKAKKIVTEQIADSKSWKKNKKEKQSVKSVSVSDFLDRKAGDEDPKLVIIDMRGEQTRVLTDYSEINTVPIEDENSAPKLGQELLYNMNLVVDLLEIDVTKQSRKLVQEENRTKIITADLDLLEMQIERDAPRLKRLESVMKIIDRVSEKQMKENSRADRRGNNLSEGGQDEMEIDEGESVDSEITLSAISSLFQTLHKNFKEEFHIFGLINLLPTLISPVLSKLFESWSPLDQPDKLAEIHTAVAALGDYFEDSGEHSLRTQTRYVEEKSRPVSFQKSHRKVEY